MIYKSDIRAMKCLLRTADQQLASDMSGKDVFTDEEAENILGRKAWFPSFNPVIDDILSSK